MTLPTHLEALRDEAMQISCDAWARRKRWTLGPGIDRAGPCPVCGGKDRFSIHTQKNTFHCRRCGIAGQGVIKLVMETEGLEFTPACEVITGRRADAPVDPEHAEKLKRQAAADAERQARQQAEYREKARKDGYAIWQAGRRDVLAADEIVGAYLRLRGIDPDALARHIPSDTILGSIRGADALDYHDDRQVICAGPAMLAAIQRADGTFGAVHMTWLDPDAAKGRLALPGRSDGKPRPGKKVRGTKKGGAIRLYTPRDASRIVAGEGIESALSVMAHAFEPHTAYWALVDSGNMGGRAARDGDGKQIHDQPDIEDAEAFVPPDWCRALIYLSDGDPAESKLKEKLTRGLRRAMRARPGLVGHLVPPPGPDQDMNDLAMAMAVSQEGA